MTMMDNNLWEESTLRAAEQQDPRSVQSWSPTYADRSNTDATNLQQINLTPWQKCNKADWLFFQSHFKSSRFGTFAQKGMMDENALKQ